MSHIGSKKRKVPAAPILFFFCSAEGAEQHIQQDHFLSNLCENPSFYYAVTTKTFPFVSTHRNCTSICNLKYFYISDAHKRIC